MLLLPGVGVQSLVRELRAHKPHGTTKQNLKKKKERKESLRMATICIDGDPFYLSMILEAGSLEIEVSGSVVPSEASLLGSWLAVFLCLHQVFALPACLCPNLPFVCGQSCGIGAHPE